MTLSDFGHIIFGGEVQLSKDEKVELKKAFEIGLDRDLVEGGRIKCGYCFRTLYIVTPAPW